MRNTFKPLIPTIACQIAIVLPEIRPLVELVIERDPIIFDKSLATQLQSLTIQPLKDLSASGKLSNPETTPRLVVIDGLDECNDPKIQTMIVREIAHALRRFTVPPLKFLIASRPEQCIIHTFNSAALNGLWRSLVLDDTYKPDDDIRLFLTESFEEIKTSRTSFRFPVIWPSQSDIDTLVANHQANSSMHLLL
ncbi:hypothetical protein BDN70DRAFT_881886 [Pholiota conissans]|uniref:Nephrocystin 3-like N-terminal domain-containing protein n=1 Tax=Pholiota conissans TaxID=109636 RepID=A0A9P5YW89_9AGAR|nr:hypothetical protein BDN70DRAFT_881886 [Pholiota conissans]